MLVWHSTAKFSKAVLFPQELNKPKDSGLIGKLRIYRPGQSTLPGDPPSWQVHDTCTWTLKIGS